MEKHTWCRTKNLMDASLWEGNLLQYAWYTSAILKHVKLLGLAEQNHGYLTSLHRIRSDKISDKEMRVRKFPTVEMATMLWSHMVIKFDNDRGLIHGGYYTVVRRYEFYFSNERSEWVKYCFCHKKIKFISSSRRVMFSLWYREKDIDKIIDIYSPKSNCEGSNL